MDQFTSVLTEFLMCVNLSFQKERKNYFKNKKSTKKSCISKFYGSFYIQYLLTTPGSFKLNHLTDSFQKSDFLYIKYKSIYVIK